MTIKNPNAQAWLRAWILLTIAAITIGLGPEFGLAAQESSVCPSYQGRIVQPITIDAALTRFNGASLQKDEFETSAQFRARQRAAVVGEIGALVISKDVDPKYIKYDADSQEFVIQTYLFDNANMSYRTLTDPGPIQPRSVENVDVVISETDAPDGTFAATNAYGASATVTKVKRVTKGIWERSMSDLTDGLFENGSRGSTLLKMTIPPEKARFLKSQIKIAFLVVPFAPYLVSGVGRVGETTLSRPIQIVNELTVLTADIQCAFLLDSANTVLGSFPTN